MRFNEEEVLVAKQILLKALENLWDGKGVLVTINAERTSCGNLPLHEFIRSAISHSGLFLNKQVADKLVDVIHDRLSGEFSVATWAKKNNKYKPQTVRRKVAENLLRELNNRNYPIDLSNGSLL